MPVTRCGIVMPISSIENCSTEHWSEVKTILSEAIEDAGFEASLVSEADEIGLIHKRIIQNLYDNPIVVCDVSAKNPNVMFELGIRLAFDKPTIIVKDDATSYSFDTSNIEHIEYPRDLRFTKIVDFKEKLSDKIKKTHQAANEDPNYTTFLKHFGNFIVPKINKKEVSEVEFILEEIKSLRNEFSSLAENSRPSPQRVLRRVPPMVRGNILNACMRNVPKEKIEEATQYISGIPKIKNVSTQEREPGHYHIIATGEDGVDFKLARNYISENFPR